MKKFFLLLLAVLAVSLAYAEPPKYVFLFIGDGMSTPQRMIADEFSRAKGNGQLVMNTLPEHATTRTCSANSLVTDSAAAATAIACGVKTDNGKLGVDPQDRRLESVAEVAKKSGKKVGIVTSVTINHATPGGFYAHQSSRSRGYEIGLDLIASGFDYFAGGGLGKFADRKKSKQYKGNIYDLAAKRGYVVTSTKAEFQKLRPGCGKVFARGGSDALPYEIDADGSVPTLAEFTAKGIELLDNPDGFFMMVEGGSIDWCGHGNEAAGNLTEVLGLDRAVRVAMEFAKRHPKETLIVVTGDHETGGMTMGFAGTGYHLYMDRLALQTCTTGEFVRRVRKARKAKPELGYEDVKPMLEKAYGFKFSGKGPMVITPAEERELKNAFVTDKHGKTRVKAAQLGTAARIIMSHKAGIGWTSGAHTALPVLTTSWGKGAENFTGFIDNTDISNKLKALLRK
ncbi:MAG: alkaline phosphatase [Lentisphaeria bacterium]|nr:alkaline phosphatase [Lentisphaeria bacterium]